MNHWLFGSDEEQVTFYPTYGYQKDDHWVIPLRIFLWPMMNQVRR
jgi:hypothetical protein